MADEKNPAVEILEKAEQRAREPVTYYPSGANLRVPPSGMEGDAIEDGKRANVDALRTTQPESMQFERQVDPISARATGVPEQGPTVRNREIRKNLMAGALEAGERAKEEAQAKIDADNENPEIFHAEVGKVTSELTSEDKETLEAAKTPTIEQRRAALYSQDEADIRREAARLGLREEDTKDLGKQDLVEKVLEAQSDEQDGGTKAEAGPTDPGTTLTPTPTGERPASGEAPKRIIGPS